MNKETFNAAKVITEELERAKKCVDKYTGWQQALESLAKKRQPFESYLSIHYLNKSTEYGVSHYAFDLSPIGQDTILKLIDDVVTLAQHRVIALEQQFEQL